MNADRAIEALMGAMKEPASIAFSGGLDSSFLAFLSKDMDMELVVTGLPGSHDLVWAEKAAELLGLPLKKVILSQEMILDSAKKVSDILGTDDLVIISFELPLFFVSEASDRKYVVTGQGSDELFGGYSRYGRMDGEELANSMKKDLYNLINGGIERDRAIASYFGKELITPYLCDDFLEEALRHAASERRGGSGKELLRELAQTAGLPEDIVTKRKKAAQYGSGIMKVLKKHRDILK